MQSVPNGQIDVGPYASVRETALSSPRLVTLTAGFPNRGSARCR
jgi:hypothetical protein